MPDFSLHLAPNAPWIWLAGLTLLLAALGIWTYRFRVPHVAPWTRRGLTLLRVVALSTLVWLLAQPVLERVRAGDRVRVVAFVDGSSSMQLPAEGGGTRAERAQAAVDALRDAWRGKASVEVLTYGRTLALDTLALDPGATATGDALAALARSNDGARASAVVLLSDGAVNAGADPSRAAGALGIPVHAVTFGAADAPDRAVTGVDASGFARVGEPVPLSARVTSTEARGVPMIVRLLDGAREIDRATAIAPGDGAEVTVPFRPVATAAGLAVWTVRVDSLAGEITDANNARQVAVEVTPGRLGVLIVTAGLNWDLAFLRRALRADEGLEVTTWNRNRGEWQNVESGRSGAAPDAATLRGSAVVVLDAMTPGEVGPAFDQALARHVRDGAGLLLLGGPPPGLSRFGTGALAADLAFDLSAGALAQSALPAPAPDAMEITAWDDDPARSERAWRSAAPLAAPAPIVPRAGDRILIGSQGAGPPLMFARRIGRGQVLCVNGSGVWRWSLAPNDEQGAARGERLWRRVARWLAEPVQADPLRVRPERWLFVGGENARVFATLQDASFKPVSGARVTGSLRGDDGIAREIAFEPRAEGSYVYEGGALPAGRYRLDVTAVAGGRTVGRAGTGFAVDAWRLEAARVHADTAAMGAIARASGGASTRERDVAAWAKGIDVTALATRRMESLRLWESPWVFALVVFFLGLEWGTRRRRGLP